MHRRIARGVVPALAVLMGLWLLAGCGGGSDDDTTTTEVTKNSAGPAESGVSLPDGFPADEVPLPAGAEIIKAQAMSDAGWRVSLEVHKDHAGILERYGAQLTDAGFSVEIGAPTSQTLSAWRAEWSIQVVRNGDPRVMVQVLS